MDFKDIKIKGEALVTAEASEVDRLENELGTRLPSGYREYVTTLGEGEFSEYIRIYSPRQVRSHLAQWRTVLRDYWFWDEGQELLPKDRAVECIAIGDTIDSDVLVVHPSNLGQLFILPRHSGQIFIAGTNLRAAIEWICSSGKIVQSFTEREFRPIQYRD